MDLSAARRSVVSLAVTLSLGLYLSSCGKQQPEPLPPQPLPQPSLQPDELPQAGFYDNSQATPIFTMLNGAKATIDIEIYEMADADVRAAIRDAVARKVKVRVVKEPEPINSSCDVFAPIKPEDDPECADQKKLKDEIVSSGGGYVPFNKAKLCATPEKICFEHGKMIIADKKAVLISTGNFNSSNLCNLSRNPSKCNRDFTMIERDPRVVNLLSYVFESDFKGESYDLKKLLSESGLKNRVTISPLSLEPLVELVGSAKHSIRVQNQYLKEKQLNQALFEAAKRGVKVEITLASLCSFGPPNSRDSENSKTLFQSFEAAGFSVRFLPSRFKINGKPGYMHAKAIVIDDRVAWVGSVNGSMTAMTNNREFGLIFTQREWVDSLNLVLKSDHQSPDTENWAESLACLKDDAPENGDRPE